MKLRIIGQLLLVLGALLSGCYTEPQPAGVAHPTTVPFATRPKVVIVSARKIEDGKIEVKIHLENLGLQKYEMNVGLGFNPTEEQLNRLPMGSIGSNYNIIAHKQVVDGNSKEVSVVLNPRGTPMPSKFNGMIGVNISEYPHGVKWSPLAHDSMIITGP